MDLNLRLYIGSIDDKLWALERMAQTAYTYHDDDRLEKAMRQIKKAAEDTKLKKFTQLYEEMGEMMRKY